MTQTLIGLDYAGIPAIKITKGVIDAALEPDENVGSFLYNSKWAADYKIAGIELMPFVGTTFFPPGSGLSNYTRYTEVYAVIATENNVYYRLSHFPILAYTMPLCEVKTKRISNGRFVGSMIVESNTGYEGRGANWRTLGRDWFGWGAGMSVYYNSTTGSIDYGTQIVNHFAQPSGVTNEVFYNNLVVWNLPGDESAILDGTPQTPVDGAHVIEIDSAGVRVAKPGFDLRSIARPTQIAFDTANHPTKIIGAADISCPVGVTSYDIGVVIPANAVADIHFYTGSTVVYPADPRSQPFGAEYWFSGSTINFSNTSIACRARFIIYANSTEGTTSGDNDVIRQFASGGEDVVQILRPGAGASPAFADIVIDSRWPCIQILKQGFISVGSGVLTHTIDFDGDGCFPMVKYMTIHGTGSGAGVGASAQFVASWSKRIRPAFMNIAGNRDGATWTFQQAGDSTYCDLTANQAVFHTHRGNPIRRYYATSADYTSRTLSYEYDTSPLYGIRYYILGIPA